MTVLAPSRSIDAEYYDGETPIPVSGILRIYPAAMSFEPQGGTADEMVSIVYRDVVDISIIDGQVRVAVKGNDPASAGGMITFFNYAAYGRLRTLMSASGSGPLSALAVFMKHGPVRKKVMAALVAIPAVTMLIYMALYESYRLLPQSVDDRLGNLITERLTEEFKPHKNRKLEAVLDRIKKRLVKKDSGRTYKILILDHHLPNAFALPDGHIIILTGLVNASNSPEEIAGVMAHEISHVESRHGIRQMIRVLGMSYLLHMIIGAGFEELEAAETISELSSLLVFLKYSRQFEREADEEAVRLLRRTGIRCRGLIDLFSRMSDMPKMRTAIQWLDTHPDMKERIDYLSAECRKERFGTRPILRRGETWSRIKNASN